MKFLMCLMAMGMLLAGSAYGQQSIPCNPGFRLDDITVKTAPEGSGARFKYSYSVLIRKFVDRTANLSLPAGGFPADSQMQSTRGFTVVFPRSVWSQEILFASSNLKLEPGQISKYLDRVTGSGPYVMANFCTTSQTQM